ncbi:MAG: YfiR family protein [bacterium]
MRRNKKSLIFIILVICISLLSTDAGSPMSNDTDIDDLKAAFIYNFTKYITWPHMDKFNSFRIGVLGESKILTSFQQMAGKKLIDDKPITIRYYDNIQDINYCHILFISESNANQIEEILLKLKNQPTLTVSDTPGFCERGIMINFFSQGEVLKFEMNPGKLENAGLKISSQLQKLARIIR